MRLEMSVKEMKTRGGVLDRLMDTVFDESILIDRDCRIIHCSENAFCGVGKKSKEMCGQLITDYDNQTPFKAVMESGKNLKGHWIVNAYRKAVMTDVFPVFEGQDVIGALGIIIFENLNYVKNVLKKMDNKPEQKLSDEIYANIARREASYTFDSFIGKCEATVKLIEYAKVAAKTEYPILITGETGTGKEIFANSIHVESGKNAFHPFVKINCTAIPAALLESELFGYQKGAFTGAVADKKGKFELAANGSILLDEIEGMDISLQGKLLRVLEEKEFERVGGNRIIPLKARIIASSNQNLKKLAEEGKFRKDLFFRLSTIEVKIPPLRERKEDVPQLVEYLSLSNGLDLTFSDQAMTLLQDYDWLGNVRELRNTIIKLGLTQHGQKIDYHDILPYLDFDETTRASFGMTPDQAEKEMIIQYLSQNGYNVRRTAECMSISKSTLYNKMEKYAIDKRSYMKKD